MCDYAPIHGAVSMVWLCGQELRNKTGKLVTRKFKKVVYGQTSLSGQKKLRYL